MSFFCSGALSNSRKRAFTRLILDKACCFFLPPFSFQIRVGGLYLLYSLHGCQTAVPTQHVRNTRNTSHAETELSCFFWPVSASCPQIRLALKDWEHVQKFEKDARDAQHWDAVYILQQMLSHKAFHFTAMPTLVSSVFHHWHCGQVDCPGSRVKGEHVSVYPKTFNIACLVCLF